jgi:hypothetical protein
MRNLVEYPIKKQEILDYLIQLRIKEIMDNSDKIGNMNAVIVQETIRFIEKYYRKAYDDC